MRTRNQLISLIRKYGKLPHIVASPDYLRNFPILEALFPSSSPVEVDPYYDSVVSLLHADGNTSDVHGATWSLLSATTAGAAKYGSASLDIAASGYAYSSSIYCGIGSLTAEFWIKKNWTVSSILFDIRPNGSGYALLSMEWNVAGTRFSVSYTPSGQSSTGFFCPIGAPPNNSDWHHIAIVRFNFTYHVFLNGALIGSDVPWEGFSPTHTSGQIQIGNDAAMLIDDFRLTTAERYVLEFTPATSAFPNVRDSQTDTYWGNVVSLLHFDGHYKDVKGRAWTAVGNAVPTAIGKYGAGALALDGTGDRITTPDSDDFHFGSGDFTVEGYIYYTTETTGYGTIAAQWEASGGDYGWAIFTPNNVDNKLYFNYSTTGANTLNKNVTWNPTSGTWYHVAVSRNGNNLRFFVDGTQVGVSQDMTGVTIYNSSRVLQVGGMLGTGYCINGRIDDVRITKGVGRYTANFTPSAEAFPNA